MPSAGTLVSDKYELLPQTSFQGKNDYRFNYGEQVSLYTFSINNGVPSW
jgi:hypothetical protein